MGEDLISSSGKDVTTQGNFKWNFYFVSNDKIKRFLPSLEPRIRRVVCRCKRCCPSHSPPAGTRYCHDIGSREDFQWMGSGIWDQWPPGIEPWRRWGAWCHPPPWESRSAHPPPPEQLQPTQSYFWSFSLSLKFSQKFHSSSTSSTTLSKLCKNWSYDDGHNIKNIRDIKKDQKNKMVLFLSRVIGIWNFSKDKNLSKGNLHLLLNKHYYVFSQHYKFSRDHKTWNCHTKIVKCLR